LSGLSKLTNVGLTKWSEIFPFLSYFNWFAAAIDALQASSKRVQTEETRPAIVDA
jgi:hypothetical protein